MGKEAKTNAMRMLDRKKVKYEAIAYDCGEFIDGIHCADITGAPHDQSFKTLVMEGKSGGYYVFVVPIEKEVDRKAAAKSVGEKTVDMIHVKDLTKITGKSAIRLTRCILHTDIDISHIHQFFQHMNGFIQNFLQIQCLRNC